jgi:hypothetical protein
MSWWDDVRAAVTNSIEAGANEVADAAALNTWVEQLVTAIAEGDTAAIDALLGRLDGHFSATRLGELLINVAVLRQDDGAFLAVVRFVVDRAMLTAAQVLGAILAAIADDTARVRLLGVLVNRLWALEDVVRALITANLLAPGLSVLTRIVYTAGGDALVRDLLGLAQVIHASRSADAAALFTAILGALSDAATATATLDHLASLIARWVVDAEGPRVFAGEGPLVRRLEGLDVLDLPMPTWLLGVAVTRLAGATGAAMPSAVTPLAMALVKALHALGAAGDTLLAAISRVPGVFVILLPALILVAVAIPMHFLEWLGQDVRTLRQLDRALKIKELPPATTQKYMIFSDLHRDAKADTVHPRLFDVQHFAANQELYLRALEWCRDEGYCVIENGDCEELWYRPRIADRVEDRIVDVLGLHRDVYTVLRDLHRQQRYFRTRGNHDNWWLLGANRLGALEQIFGAGFEIFDAVIIPEVKNMQADLSAIMEASTQNDVVQYLLDRIPLGLSPDRYRDRKPMFVLHGHQVDFWNCDEHHFLGLIITNAIGVPADGVDALPYYLKGIDVDGNPWIKFADYVTKRRDWQELIPPFVGDLAGTPPLALQAIWQFAPWDNWPPEDVARAWARQIEFMEETDRRLRDSLSFSETLAASLSLFLGYDSAGPFRPCELPFPQIQIAMGHTHNPQSRPYLNLPEPTITVDTPKGSFDYKVSWLKVPYFNSGTGGWWEGIIWALQIDGQGQPKLVYWDRRSREPQIMSWELHDAPIVQPADVQNLVQDILAVYASGSASFSQAIAWLRSLLPFGLPALSGSPTTYQFGDLSNVEQFAAAAFGLLVTLKNLVCDPDPGHLPVEFEIDLRRVPSLEPRVGTLSRLSGPSKAPPAHTLRAWMRHYGLAGDAKWRSADRAAALQLSAALMTTAFAHNAGLLQSIGMLTYIAASRSRPLEIKFDERKGRLGLRVHPGKPFPALTGGGEEPGPEPTRPTRPSGKWLK